MSAAQARVQLSKIKLDSMTESWEVFVLNQADQLKCCWAEMYIDQWRTSLPNSGIVRTWCYELSALYGELLGLEYDR